ncbi:MAG: alcohol dehydrogenase catalytic domain-containing protein [Cyanobacteria bacterium SBC]|nr:alcohol dehydrogenase catalytic domain-containing protein [Cyanobacteria bacterium SBC]
MKAQVFRGVDRLCYEDLPQPIVEPGEVLINVEATGVSPQDLQFVKSNTIEPPCVFGSEIVGTIAAVGEGVTQCWEGQRVATIARIPCMRCRECLADRFSLCLTYQQIATTAGFGPFGGGFAEVVKVPAHIVKHGGLIPLPGHVTFDRATFIQGTNACLNALDRVRYRPGQLVWILGAGSIGLTLVLLAKHFGLKSIVSDPNVDRLDFALDLGADVAFCSDSDDLHTKVRAFTDGRGVETAVLTQPSQVDFFHALDGLQPGSQLLCLSDYALEDAAVLDPLSLTRRQIDLLSCSGLSFRLQSMAIDLVFDYRLPFDAIVSDRVALADLPEAIARSTAEKTATRKILVYPQ